MFITLSIYHARPGEEDAILALHEEWQRDTLQKCGGFISGELLCSTSQQRTYIAIVRFESEDAYKSVAADWDREFWYSRLLSMVEPNPIVVTCRTDWQVDRGIDTSPNRVAGSRSTAIVP